MTMERMEEVTTIGPKHQTFLEQPNSNQRLLRLHDSIPCGKEIGVD
jgi:hypothetical protein